MRSDWFGVVDDPQDLLLWKYATVVLGQSG